MGCIFWSNVSASGSPYRIGDGRAASVFCNMVVHNGCRTRVVACHIFAPVYNIGTYCQTTSKQAWSLGLRTTAARTKDSSRAVSYPQSCGAIVSTWQPTKLKFPGVGFTQSIRRSGTHTTLDCDWKSRVWPILKGTVPWYTIIVKLCGRIGWPMAEAAAITFRSLKVTEVD